MSARNTVYSDERLSIHDETCAEVRRPCLTLRVRCDGLEFTVSLPPEVFEKYHDEWNRVVRGEITRWTSAGDPPAGTRLEPTTTATT